ncbi:hypothetical protein TPHA_0K00470 [Tetrapisispora phaffii CBS 4417]|uniref:GOLD domain-containing protein n=1 Tax=Tetrapisispora phaffii (strain ATCC 24235 / CBS 4417 / NBRC 1672 / NRRL Y-8282 / UCD 70-5) TaxID=1071381 RepID=G8BZ53_TETPH|nr:hypothetical protein TPHA_0K00470 [Tetrapisispora phaffii CBS 4417]CCE65181.1 hypothetical protein TPHA_0K00470 [Tetrapisispora phaffii CBS 4417]
MRFGFYFLFLALISSVWGLHLEIAAIAKNEPVCVRDFAAEGQLVVVELDSDGSDGDGQELSVSIQDPNGNVYRTVKDFIGDLRIPFTALGAGSFDVCFTNRLINGKSGNNMKRIVEMDIEIGSQARDWNKLNADEKLKPVELKLRQIEELLDEVDDRMFYMKSREARLRDTNESTNERVTRFSFLIIVLITALAAWQLSYLKAFFKAKHII